MGKSSENGDKERYLSRRLTAEEKQYYEEIYINNYRFLLSRVKKYNVHRNDWEDIIQDSIMGVLKMPDRISSVPPKKIRSYLSIVVKNECVMWHYRQERQQEIIADQVGIETIEDKVSEEDLISRLDEHKMVQAMLSSLSERDQALLVGHFIIGYSDDELAERMGYQPQSIRALLSRAKKRAYEYRWLYNQDGEEGDKL